MTPAPTSTAATRRQPRCGAVMRVVCAAVAGLVLGLPATGVRAERADRELPLSFDAGQLRIDGKRKVQVLSGGVEITRGSLVLKAALVELRDTPSGQIAVAMGDAGQPASFRQKREGLDETIEGEAQQIEYDTTQQTVRFSRQAQVRLLRGREVADRISGETIVYDHGRDAFEVQGGAAESGEAGSGRVRGVVTPRPATGGGSAR